MLDDGRNENGHNSVMVHALLGRTLDLKVMSLQMTDKITFDVLKLTHSMLPVQHAAQMTDQMASAIPHGFDIDCSNYVQHFEFSIARHSFDLSR